MDQEAASISASSCPSPTPSQRPEMVHIKMRGFIFEIPWSNLEKLPKSRITKEATANSSPTCGIITLNYNRNTTLFEAILDMYLIGELHIPARACWKAFERELEFWEVEPERLSPCCWDQYQRDKEHERTLTYIREQWAVSTCPCPPRNGDNKKDSVAVKLHRVKHATWVFLEEPCSSTGAKAFSWIFMLLVTLSLTIMAVDTIPFARIFDESMRDTYANLTSGRIMFFLRHSHPHQVLNYLELGIAFVLIFEFGLRLICSPVKVVFMKAPKNIVALVAVVPSMVMVGMWMATGKADFSEMHDNPDLTMVSVVFFRLRLLRVHYLSRLGNHVPALRIMYLSIRASYAEIILLTILLMGSSLFFGSLLFFVELQMDQLRSIPHGMWWALVTMTTVGYGDVAPESPLGYTIGTACAVSGIVMMALPIPVVANNFNKFYIAMKSMRCMQKITKTKSIPNVST